MSEEMFVKPTESKNKNLGKFNRKAIYLNLSKYGYYFSYDKVNYKIPEYLQKIHEKIDLELASSFIEHKIKWNEKQAKEEGPKKDSLDGESD
jgi:topoisomerase IA-like protein